MKINTTISARIIYSDSNGFPELVPVTVIKSDKKFVVKSIQDLKLPRNEQLKLQIISTIHESLFFNLITYGGKLVEDDNSENYLFEVLTEIEETIDVQNNLYPQLISKLPEGRKQLENYNSLLAKNILKSKGEALLVVTILGNIHTKIINYKSDHSHLSFKIPNDENFETVLSYISSGQLVLQNHQFSEESIIINGKISLSHIKKSKNNYELLPTIIEYGNKSTFEKVEIKTQTDQKASSFLSEFYQKIRFWVNLLRIQIFAFTFISLMLGSLYSFDQEEFKQSILLLELIALFCFQAVANLLNDFTDHRSESDEYAVLHTKLNAGSRFLQVGLITERQLIQIIFVFLIFGIISGLIVAYQTDITNVLLLGVLGSIILLIYNSSPFKLSYKWYGDFLFTLSIFPVILIGSNFVQKGNYGQFNDLLLLGVSMGIYLTGILSIGNLLSYDAEKAAGKVSFSVKFGKHATVRVVQSIILIHTIIQFAFILYLKDYIILFPLFISVGIIFKSLLFMIKEEYQISKLESSYKLFVFSFLVYYIGFLTFVNF